MMKTSPDILDNIRMMIIEHDFNTEDDYEYFKKTLDIKGYKCEDSYLKTDRYGPGMNWDDGLKSDPIFVSVWKSWKKKITYLWTGTSLLLKTTGYYEDFSVLNCTF